VCNNAFQSGHIAAQVQILYIMLTGNKTLHACGTTSLQHYIMADHYGYEHLLVYSPYIYAIF